MGIHLLALGSYTHSSREFDRVGTRPLRRVEFICTPSPEWGSRSAVPACW
jgi:hypothetical protein